jgi:hypothetical protein
MPFSWTRRRVCLVRTDVSEERVAYIFRVEIIHERGRALAAGLLATANAVPRSWINSTLKMVVICSSETSIITIPTRHYIQEDSIRHLIYSLLFVRKMCS